MQDVNRLKLVLVEQKKTSKWLSEALRVNRRPRNSVLSYRYTN